MITVTRLVCGNEDLKNLEMLWIIFQHKERLMVSVNRYYIP